MQVTIDKSALNHTVQAVSRFASPRSTLPILQGILIEAESAALRFSATDMEIGIKKAVPAEVAETGRAVVPAKQFAELVKRLPDGNINMKLNNGQLTVQYGLFSEFSIATMPADEFPLLPLPEGNRLKVPGKELKTLIDRTIVAVDWSGSRPVFKGVLLAGIGQEINMVATDTHRLALSRYNTAEPADIPGNLIIPGSILEEVGRILDEKSETEIVLADGQVAFLQGETVIFSRLLEGQFPDYNRVIPRKFTTETRIKKEELLDSLRRAQLLTDKREKIPVKLTVADGKIKVSVQTEEGRMLEEVNAEVTGEQLVIGFNVAYLIDGLEAADAEEVNIKFTGPVGPAIIQAVDCEDYLYLALPVRLAKEDEKND